MSLTFCVLRFTFSSDLAVRHCSHLILLSWMLCTESWDARGRLLALCDGRHRFRPSMRQICRGSRLCGKHIGVVSVVFGSTMERSGKG